MEYCLPSRCSWGVVSVFSAHRHENWNIVISFSYDFEKLIMDNDDVPYFPLAWREKVLQNQVKLGLEFSISSLGANWPILVQPGLKWNWVGWGVDFTKRKYIALSFFPIISLSFFLTFLYSTCLCLSFTPYLFISLNLFLSLVCAANWGGCNRIMWDEDAEHNGSCLCFCIRLVQ